MTAFEQLKSEGYVEGRTGSGTYVSKVLPEAVAARRRTRAEGRFPHRRISLSAYAQRLQPFRSLPAQPVRAFRANQPALDLFPTALWAQVAARRLRRASTKLAGRRRNAGIPSAARSGRGIPEHIARRAMHAGAGADRLRRAGGTRSHGPPGAESGRTGVDGGTGISGRGGGAARRGSESLWRARR